MIRPRRATTALQFQNHAFFPLFPYHFRSVPFSFLLSTPACVKIVDCCCHRYNRDVSKHDQRSITHVPNAKTVYKRRVVEHATGGSMITIPIHEWEMVSRDERGQLDERAMQKYLQQKIQPHTDVELISTLPAGQDF